MKNYEQMKKELMRLTAMMYSRLSYFDRNYHDEIHSLMSDQGFIDYLVANGDIIPVTERLPEFDKRVYTWDGEYFGGNFYLKESAWRPGNPGWANSYNFRSITHWMPKPNDEHDTLPLLERAYGPYYHSI